MSQAVSILYLEDDASDYELALELLAQSGIPSKAVRVETEDGFRAGLGLHDLQIILADYHLPGYNGLSALSLARKLRPEVPFVFVSGTLGEEVAIAALTNGARDYVLKQRLMRLVPAVRRILQDEEAARTLRRTEEQLRQAQKMEIVGQLSAGIAHDFGNLLTIILGYSDLLLQQVDGIRSVQNVGQIRTAAERALAIVRQLTAFARGTTQARSTFDLNSVVSGNERLLRMLAGQKIEVNVAITDFPIMVAAELNQLQQVILNLAANARDAMPEGGVLTITSAKVPRDGTERAALRVSDTGVGMSLDVRERIFEPFFTTKEMDGGTGLGLWMVRKIAGEHGWTIQVESERGKGTTFEIVLPLESTTPADARPVREREGALVIVGDNRLEGTIATALAELGYETTRNNGLADLLIATNGIAATRVLITDSPAAGALGTGIGKTTRDEKRWKVVYIEKNAIDPNPVAGADLVLRQPFTLENLRSGLARLQREDHEQPGCTELPVRQ
ncbi:MAG: ATP-binding protein [Bryobacteraceae bacterium]